MPSLKVVLIIKFIGFNWEGCTKQASPLFNYVKDNLKTLNKAIKSKQNFNNVVMKSELSIKKQAFSSTKVDNLNKLNKQIIKNDIKNKELLVFDCDNIY